MKTRTLLALGLLVLALGMLLWQKERQIEEVRHVYDHALVPLFDPASASRIHIDNLERSVQLTLERDAQGTWYLTDPLAYPAVQELIHFLLTALAEARGPLDPLVDLSSAKLDPPLVVVEVTSSRAGAELRQRVEVGRVDLDGRRVFARVPGHPERPRGSAAAVLLVPRSLYTTLDRNPDDYRFPRATQLLRSEITGLRRRGRVRVDTGEGLRELGLAFALDGGGWRTELGPRVTLDPAAVGSLIGAATDLRVERFVADAPRTLADFGLDAPAFEIELDDVHGRSTTLRFGRPEAERLPLSEGRWFALREGFDHVFEVSWRDVFVVVAELDTCFETRLVRALREDVLSLELVRGSEVVLLERGAQSWTVGRDGGPAAPADDARVDEILSALDQTSLGAHRFDVAFTPSDPELSFALSTQSGLRFAGRIGAAHRDPVSAEAGRLFLREGDEAPALLAERVAALLATPLEELRSRLAHRISEERVHSLELARAERSLVFEHRGLLWYPTESRLEAPPAFHAVLERLLALRVEGWIGSPSDPSDLGPEPHLRVRIRPSDSGESISFELAKGPDGRALALLENGATAVIPARLWEDARALFGP